MTTQRAGRRNEQGMFMVDIIMALIIISLALGAAVMVFRSALVHSADPLIIDQNVAIARSYLEEILAQNYCDPGDVGLPGACNDPCPLPEGGGRSAYDNVCDYDNPSDTGVKGRDGNPVAGLENFNVSVNVVAGPTDKLGPVGSYSADGDTLRVDVTVSFGASWRFPVTLSGYRTFYRER